MAEDIRFSKKAATLTHASARGKVKRNAGNFTRGSQLFHHEILMTWAGIRMPLYVWVGTAVLLLCILVSLTFKNHEVQLVLMKLYAEAWGWVQLNPNKPVNLTLPSGQMVQGTMSMVPYHPAVERAWAKAVQVSISAGLGAAFICVPLTVWFVDFSKRRGTDILTERHERGAVLVNHSELAQAITSHNWKAHVSECRKRRPAVDPDKILAEPLKDRVRAGLHAPYRLAGVPVPWRLEQSHAMFIGTTGAGKTTELKKIVTQARERGHRCVIFDLTGTFVESFYDAETDIILNPMDRRCVPWSIFNDCDNYAEFMSAATALVPSGNSAEDDFWQKSARTLFVEMCVKMIKMSIAAQTGYVSATMRPQCAGSIGRRIKTVRAALGMSQHAMALQLGVAHKTIKNYEGGHRDPPSSLIAAICEQFRIDAAWLLLGDASRPMFQQEQARVGGDKRILDAQLAAVKATMAYLEKHYAQARDRSRNANGEGVVTGKLLYALFQHDTSRALDPQSHTHAVIAAMTQDKDGNWKALWNGEIWKNNTVLGSIYNAALRTNLEKLGYETQITGKHGQFEIKGVARDVIEAFSQRRLAYAINMHQAQGDTRDMAIGEMHSSARHLSNQRLALVMMTRVRDDITIVTNDRDRLLAQIGRNPGDKTSALETLGEKQVEAKRSGRDAGEFRPTIPDHLRAPEDRQATAPRIDPASLRATPQLDVPERNIERSR